MSFTIYFFPGKIWDLPSFRTASCIGVYRDHPAFVCFILGLVSFFFGIGPLQILHK